MKYVVILPKTGTDASMASHVGNVQRRKYVQLDERTRQMKPSELGLALCHAYMLIDPERFGVQRMRVL